MSTIHSNKMPLNVWLLTLAQAFLGTVGAMVVFIGGLVGVAIAPEKSLATLPVASIIIGTALSTIPVSLLMKKFGRKKTFVWLIGFSIINALFAAYAVYIQQFYLFCFVALLLGITNATMMQFRFAAMESVPDRLNPKAASTVLLGGLAAAFLGPEMGLMGKGIFSVNYTGSFVLLAGLFMMGLLVITFFKDTEVQENQIEKRQRPLKVIAKQHVFLLALSSAAIGYVVMSFVMTATPISMHEIDGHSLSITKTTIQSHIVAMFLPSLFTAWIIRKIGIPNMMLLGLLAYVFCIGIGYFYQDPLGYWISLVLLGVGWNFLFIGGTSLLPTSYRPSERFKVQALNDFMVFGAQAIAALSAGKIIFHLGWKMLLLTTIPLILLQVGIVLRWKIKR